MTKKGKTRRKPAKRKKAKRTLFSRRPILISLAVLVTVVFLAYSPVLQADFVDIDDYKIILDNDYHFLKSPKYFFTTGFEKPHYKPVTYLTWMMEYRLVGAKPLLFHLNNLILHLFNTVFVFFIIRKVSAQFKRLKGSELEIAFFSALLFGLHPMHVESVAWVVERKDVLFAFFYLMSIVAYIRYLEKRSILPLVVAVVSYLLSIFSKAPGITLIGIVFLLDFVWQRKLSARLIYEKAGFFGVFGFAMYAFGVFSHDGGEGSLAALVDTDRKLAVARNVADVPSVWGKATLASMRSVLWYLHSWLPFRLSLGYPREAIIGFCGILINVFPAILAAAAALLVWFRKKHRLLFFAHAFFFITLSPAIARLGLGIGIFMSDRYVYLPLLGLMFLLTAWIYTMKERGALNLRVKRSILAAIAVTMGVLSFSAGRTWKNTETLWTNVINKYPNVDYAYVNRGSYYRQNGQIEKGLQDISKALTLDDNANARIQRGLMYRQLSQPQKAVSDYARAIELDPGNTQAYTNRGNAYLDMGRFRRAIQDYNVTIAAEPRHVKALVNRAIAYASLKDYDLASIDFSAAESFHPKYKEIYGNRAIMHFGWGKYRKAIQDYNSYLSFVPDDHQAYNDIGIVYQVLNQHQKAIQSFTKAISITPARDYFLVRARSYDALGQTTLAQKDRQTAGR